jgi:hypothetical protein
MTLDEPSATDVHLGSPEGSVFDPGRVSTANRDTVLESTSMTPERKSGEQGNLE